MNPLRNTLRFSLPLLLCVTTATAGAPADLAADRDSAYLARVREVVDWRAGAVNLRDPGQGDLAGIAAKLLRGEDADWCSRRVIELMKEPAGDMFWMFPCVAVAFTGREGLSPAAKAAIRDAWRTYMPQRGDTENHWVMYYSSLYLMSELWPGEPGDRWFTGKSSDENREEAKAFLLHWIDLTTTRGQGEYDCTHYIGEYAIPMLYLAAWARDPAMRLRGRMMLDYVLADFAVENLDGSYVGAHARTDDRGVLETWNNLSSFFAWLFLGNCPPPAGYGGWGNYFAIAAHHYRMPEVIHRIGTDRSQPYLHRELKRTRHRWRNSDLRNAPVYKTTYVTRDYAVGSDQGGLLQPIQHHSWDVTWAVPSPRGVHNTMFSVQAHYSAFELQMYFTEFPDWMPEAVTYQGKPSYNKEDKLLGGSPHEQIFQETDTIVSLTDAPAGATFEHVNGFFSKDLTRMEEDASGWIFAQGGNAYLAYRPLAAYEWKPIATGDRRLVSAGRKNGTILQAAAASEFRDWEAFKAAIRALPLTVRLEPTPRVEFTTLRGRRVVCEYGATPAVDGRAVDYGAWPLFGGPFLNAARDSRRLKLTHGSLERELDFVTLTVTDRVKDGSR
jgi:hypothetical protein